MSKPTAKNRQDYAAFVFDFDLTLADSSKAIYACYQHTLSVYGYPVPEEDVVFRTIGRTLIDSIDILTETPMNPKREEMRQTYKQKADEIMAEMTRFYPDTFTILDGLQKQGKKTGIVSSKNRFRICQTFEVHYDRTPIDCIIGFEDITEPKPDPSGLKKAIEALSVAPEDVLYIGDSFIDAQTAQNAGVDFGAVLTGSTGEAEFLEYPHVVIAPDLKHLFFWL